MVYPLVGLGVADVADCFHRIRLPESMIGYVCWPSVPAGKLGIQESEGAKLDPKDPVWMAHLMLPMGFSWSLYLAQDAKLNQHQKSGSMISSHLMTGLGSP